MEFQDQILKCADCGADFTFTSGEQTFFQEKQLRYPPRRCKGCKAKRISTFPPSALHRNHPSHPIVETEVECSQCGKRTTVPFKPSQGRPVLCRDCFSQKRQSVSA
jgi:CxxC-x17-CxxC domain-containing protein